MKVLTVCYLIVIGLALTGCFGIQDLQVRIAQAEVDLNSTQVTLDAAREDYKVIQGKIDEGSTKLDAAIQSGNVEAQIAAKKEVDKARVEAARINDRIIQAEKDNDQLKNVVTAVKNQTENATGPMDYLLAIGSVAASIFGVGGVVSAMGQRQRRKISEANQLNPRKD